MQTLTHSSSNYTLNDDSSKFKLVFNSTTKFDFRPNHEIKLTDLLRPENLYYFDNRFADKSYNLLEMGLGVDTVYSVKIFRIEDRITKQECFDQLNREKNLYLGALGLALMWKQQSIFPINKKTVSFAGIEPGHNGVPFIERTVIENSNLWRFDENIFSNGLSFNCAMLCISKL